MSSPVDLAYATYGEDNDKTPIIFLHGVTSSKEHWDQIPKIVADKVQRKVYVIDARNHGDSPWTDEYNFDMNVDDLLHFMDKHKIEKATLVGHSMGGITSMKAALKAPEKVDKLIIEDMGTQRLDKRIVNIIVGSLRMAKEGIKTISSDVDPKTAVKTMMDNLYEKLPDEIKRITKPDTRKKYENTIQVKPTADGKYALKCNVDVLCRALEDSDNLFSPYTGIYDGPAFVIFGDISELKIWETEDDVKKFFPKAEFIKIEDANHDVHSDQTEKFTQSLLSVLLKE